MLTDTILALFIAFFACAALCPIMIPILHRMKFGQQVRDDGPQSHLKKSGTPTMGGIMIVLAIALGCLPFLKKAPETLPVMGFTLAFGFIGFLDDFLKIHRKQSEGLKAWQKFSLQLIATGVLAYRLFRTGNYGDILLPFSGSFETGILLPLGGFFVPFVFLVVLGTAKVFMGDTGALALGGYAAAVALVLRMPLFLMLVGIIYMLEVISVMLQVGYFKATKGKRLFRMAPLHHHFELGGWSETRVVTVFTICTVILSLAAWIGLGE